MEFEFDEGQWLLEHMVCATATASWAVSRVEFWCRRTSTTNIGDADGRELTPR